VWLFTTGLDRKVFQLSDQTLHELALSLADLVSNHIVEFLDEERYFGVDDADVINELSAIARGAVSDRFNELLDDPESGWTQQLVNLPLGEGALALQSVRHVGNKPILNQPKLTAPQNGGKKRGRRRRRRKGGGGRQQKLPDIPDPSLDAADEDNYPGGPFYASEGEDLSARDRAWLANQRADDEFWGDQFNDDSF